MMIIMIMIIIIKKYKNRDFKTTFKQILVNNYMLQLAKNFIVSGKSCLGYKVYRSSLLVSTAQLNSQIC